MRELKFITSTRKNQKGKVLLLKCHVYFTTYVSLTNTFKSVLSKFDRTKSYFQFLSTGVFLLFIIRVKKMQVNRRLQHRSSPLVAVRKCAAPSTTSSHGRQRTDSWNEAMSSALSLSLMKHTERVRSVKRAFAEKHTNLYGNPMVQ